MPTPRHTTNSSPRTNQGEQLSARQVMYVWIGAKMNRVMANEAATPTTPQCKPMTNPSNVTGVENRRKRNITPGRPIAWVVAQLSVCRVVPTPARLSHCNTGTAASPLLTEDDGHKVGRDDRHAQKRGDVHRSDHLVAARPSLGEPHRLALDLGEGGEENLLQGLGDAADRKEHRVVRDAVEAERDGAEVAADEQVVDVVHEVAETLGAERLAAVGAEARAGLPSST